MRQRKIYWSLENKMSKYEHKYRCIKKIRDKSGKITGYSLFDYRTDETISRTASFVRELLKHYPNQIENLKLTSDNRIVDKRIAFNNWKEILQNILANQKITYQKSPVTISTVDYATLMKQIREIKHNQLKQEK